MPVVLVSIALATGVAAAEDLGPILLRKQHEGSTPATEDETPSWWLRPDWTERRWAVLDLAAEDWNADIADKARKLLERREPEGEDAAGEEPPKATAAGEKH